MRLYLCQPEGTVPVPAIVVIQNQDGVGEFTQEMTRRVAEAGYVGIAPDLYHRNTPEINADHQKRAGSRRDAGVINDVNAAVDLLRGCATADVSKLGIVGFCMGGRVACLMAAANPIFRAAVDFYGGGVYNVTDLGLFSSTVASNSATGSSFDFGGGIYSVSNLGTTNCTIA